MDRLCEVDDVITGPFGYWHARQTQWGLCWDQQGPVHPGNEWLVVKTEKAGGGTAHGPHDRYPDGHRVTAIMLDTLGKNPYTYHENGVVIRFYQTGHFEGRLPPEKLTLTGKFGHTTEKQRIC